MRLTVHNTSDWSADMLDWPNITAAIRRLVERFPDDITLEGVLSDIIHGRLTLWVVRDGDTTVSVVLVSFDTNPHTGHRRATIREMVGNRGVEAIPLIVEIEEWARSQGANDIDVIGREGWKRALASQGYELVAVVLRKRL